MPVADRGDAQIFWEEQGAGEPLLLIMGHGFPRQMWARHLPGLTARFRVITFDNRGVGQTVTRGWDWTIEDMAADAVAVLDAAGVDRAHVYGASMGGGIAQAVALHHPERVGSLILACTAAKAAERKVPVAQLLRHVLPAALRGRKAVKFATARVVAYGPATPTESIAEDTALLESLVRPAEGVEAQGRAVAAWEGSRSQLPGLRIPTLVIHGTDDRLVPLHYGEELARLIPGAELVVLAGAGHMYITDSTAQADEAVTSFLTAHSLQPS